MTLRLRLWGALRDFQQMTLPKLLFVFAAMAPVILIAAYGVPSLFFKMTLRSLLMEILKPLSMQRKLFGA